MPKPPRLPRQSEMSPPRRAPESQAFLASSAVLPAGALGPFLMPTPPQSRAFRQEGASSGLASKRSLDGVASRQCHWTFYIQFLSLP